MQEYQRKQLLERVEREGATVGTDIPEEITVQGESIDLKSFVFEIKRRETVPPGERDRVETARRNLRRERSRRLQQLEDGTVDFQEGERIADAVVGIDRALEALESLEETDIEREKEAKKTADRKRWLSFLRKATGQEEADSGRRGGGVQ